MDDQVEDQADEARSDCLFTVAAHAPDRGNLFKRALASPTMATPLPFRSGHRHVMPGSPTTGTSSRTSARRRSPLSPDDGRHCCCYDYYKTN